MKDHPTFLRAASMVARERQDTRFVCVGTAPTSYSDQLRALSIKLGTKHLITWGGARSHMAAVQNSLDIAVLSSISEGFPNVIGEAMACGVPCVVTDVGDTSWLVGDTGIIVPPRDPAALAQAILTMLAHLDDQPVLYKGQARVRILTQFAVNTLIENTATALTELL